MTPDMPVSLPLDCDAALGFIGGQDHVRSGLASEGVLSSTTQAVPLSTPPAVPPTISSHHGKLYVAILMSQLVHSCNRDYIYVPVDHLLRAYGAFSCVSY